MRDQDVVQGVSNGVFEFLHDRPISVVDPMIAAIAEAVAKTVRDWLDDHEDQILDRITTKTEQA